MDGRTYKYDGRRSIITEFCKLENNHVVHSPSFEFWICFVCFVTY